MGEDFFSTVLWMGLLALIVAAVFGFYGWALFSRTRAFHRAMLALRDRIDRSNDLR